MPATAAAVGFGVILKKGDGGSPEAFTDYGLEVTSVNGIGVSRSSQDATHMASPGGYAEFIHGIKTAKAVTIGFNLVPSSSTAMQSIVEGSKGNWRVQFPDNTTLTFTAGMTDFDIGDLSPDAKMTGTCVLTPSGAYAWA